MRKARFAEEQIIRILQEAVAGRPIRELCRHHGITETTFDRWRHEYGGLQVSEAKRLKALEDENRRLKKLVPSSPSTMRCSKTWRDESGDDSATAAGRHPSPGRLSGERAPDMSPGGVGALAVAVSVPPAPVHRAARALAGVGRGAPAMGHKRLHVLLRREGYRVNHKLVYRLFREEGLLVRRRRRKRVAGPRVPLPTPTEPNERWGMDLIMDSVVEGRRFRCLTMVDEYTRECPVIEVDTSLPSARVLQVLDRLATTRGLPRSLVVDHGPEFISKALDAGRIAMASSSCSFARASPWTTPTSRAFTSPGLVGGRS